MQNNSPKPLKRAQKAIILHTYGVQVLPCRSLKHFGTLMPECSALVRGRSNRSQGSGVCLRYGILELHSHNNRIGFQNGVVLRHTLDLSRLYYPYAGRLLCCARHHQDSEFPLLYIAPKEPSSHLPYLGWVPGPGNGKFTAGARKLKHDCPPSLPSQCAE